jgi:dTDP-4-amino-4,6-dideoxygalactose transaminase
MSFYPTKNLGTYGDAGMVVTGDPEWADRMITLRVHGMKPKYYHPMLGWNARIDAVQAAILRVKLPHVERWITMRQAAAGRYDELIRTAGLDGDLVRPIARPGRRHTFNQYVVRVKSADRDAVAAQLKAASVGYEIYYPRPLHLQQCLSHLGHNAGDFPVSEAACDEVLALPMFPEITAEQQARVITVLTGAIRQPVRQAA